MDEIILANRLAKSLSPRCGIRVNNDFEAVHSWLSEYKANSNTYVSYKKEARKFLLWCKEEQQLEISALSKEDFTQYISWLQTPPTSLVGASKAHLFKAKQSQQAVSYNIRVINSLMNYLVEADYIYKNPLKLIKKIVKFISPASQALEIKVRILEDNEFKAVLDTLDELPELSRKQRDFKAQAKIIFSLLYHLGLRVNELSCACWDNFKIVQGRACSL